MDMKQLRLTSLKKHDHRKYGKIFSCLINTFLSKVDHFLSEILNVRER